MEVHGRDASALRSLLPAPRNAGLAQLEVRAQKEVAAVRLVDAPELAGARLGARRERAPIAAVGVVAQGTRHARAQPLLQHLLFYRQHATQKANGTVARLSDGPQLHLQPLPQISDVRAQRTVTVVNCGKKGRDTARQCGPLSMCELIRLTHHHEQGRALRAIDSVRGLCHKGSLMLAGRPGFQSPPWTSVAIAAPALAAVFRSFVQRPTPFTAYRDSQ